MSSGPAKMTPSSSFLEHVIVNYRWAFVMFLLPLSLAYDIWFAVRNFIVFRLSTAPGRHPQKVREVQAQVRARNDARITKPMCTARPGWQTISPQNMSYKSRLHQIKVNLVDVLAVDVDNRTVTCEPLVTMGQLTRTLDRVGWTIPIVPELDDLTVGGLVMGTGVETSSHRFGLFQHICVSFELVLADGSAVTCSEEDNPDLFHAVPWSYGTLGFLTAAKIRIIPSKRFVKLTYRPAHTMADACRMLKEEVDKGDDAAQFVESLQFSADTAVIMTGEMTDTCDPKALNEIGRWHKPWFFKHVESFLAKVEETTVEYIPLRDYYHRHSRSIFWEIQDIIPFGNHPVFRYLLGWLIPPKVSLLKLTQGETLKRLYEEQHIIQDMLVPMESLRESLVFFDRQVAVYPVWLCPFALPDRPGMLRPAKRGRTEMFVDIGVYGVPKVGGFDCVETTRRIESFVRSKSGFQMLYADSYMTREEFSSMFDRTLYDEMRQRHGAIGAFPDVYDKVSKAARK